MKGVEFHGESEIQIKNINKLILLPFWPQKAEQWLRVFNNKNIILVEVL